MGSPATDRGAVGVESRAAEQEETEGAHSGAHRPKHGRTTRTKMNRAVE
jgi:hypothetical protein